ncbi:hypothetical protein BH10ACI3_BH10ACI3_08440 [soil metagenome]
MNKLFVWIAIFSILCPFSLYAPAIDAQSVASAPSSPTSSTTLVLSQVSGGNGFYTDDWVEIKNVSGSGQSLNGLSLYYGSAVGNFGAGSFALPNVSLTAGQYFLVRLTQSGTGGTALPVTPDATAAAGVISMSGTSGKVGLVNPSLLATSTCGATATPCSPAQLAAFVDWVAWGAAGNGTAGNGEGGTSVNNNVALVSTQGSVRKNAGCNDTDNNNFDFDVVTNPVPRNTATVAAPCTANNNPTGGGTANPTSVLPGQTSLLTVTVTPGSNPDSTGLVVVTDLSTIGGLAAQDFFDDGTNGDVTPNDNVFSFSATVAGDAAAGTKSLGFTVSDAQMRTGTGNISLIVQGTTNPTGTGSANPSTVAPGGSTVLTFNVTPGTTPTSTSITVTGDLSSIGGIAAQSFTNSTGNTFTFNASVGAATALGVKSLPITIGDAQGRTGTGTISLNVQISVAHTPSEHEVLGLPTPATPDVNNPHDYLLERNQYVLSYDRDKGIPNWVAWHLDSSWIGSTSRQDTYRNDPSLPAGWYQVQANDYSGSGFDRGHMCPSGDRTSSVTDNSATFLMTNFIPQAPANNQGQWNDMENYIRGLISSGTNEVYIYAGGAGQGGTGSNGGVTTTVASGHVLVPAWTWKVLVVMPTGSNDADRITKSTRVIAVIMPNVQTISGSWQSYRVPVKKVESLTGYRFFTGVRPIVRNLLKYRVDTQ